MFDTALAGSGDLDIILRDGLVERAAQKKDEFTDQAGFLLGIAAAPGAAFDLKIVAQEREYRPGRG